jgi:short-subunit dehydrogenase
MIKDEVIWITGASTGIGRALALNLAEQGNTVIISARSQEALFELAGSHANLIALPFDVSCKDVVNRVREQLLDYSPFLDRVILNAGTCEYLDIETPDWDMMQRVMTVNYFGAINTLAVAMPLLEAHPDNKAHIIGVASLATVVPFSRAEAYGASKAALQYFFDSLRVDLVKKSIDVTVINPGFVKTPLTDKNDFPMPFLLSSEQAASRMAKAIAQRPRQYDFPGRLKWLLKALGFFPSFWNKVVAPSLKM